MLYYRTLVFTSDMSDKIEIFQKAVIFQQ